MEVYKMIHSQNDKDATKKYHVTLESGRDFILNVDKDVDDLQEEVAWAAYNEAALMDDYLANVVPINDI